MFLIDSSYNQIPKSFFYIEILLAFMWPMCVFNFLPRDQHDWYF